MKVEPGDISAMGDHLSRLGFGCLDRDHIITSYHVTITTSQSLCTNKTKHECNECWRWLPYTWNPHPRPEEAWVKGTHHHKKKPQQKSNLHDSPEPTEDPTIPKAKRVCPTSRAKNLQTDKDNSEMDKTPGIPNFLFLGPTTPSLNSIQQIGKLRKLLKEALTLSSTLDNVRLSRECLILLLI